MAIPGLPGGFIIQGNPFPEKGHPGFLRMSGKRQEAPQKCHRFPAAGVTPGSRRGAGRPSGRGAEGRETLPGRFWRRDGTHSHRFYGALVHVAWMLGL